MISCLRSTRFVHVLIALGMCLDGGSAAAADAAYPTRPIRLVVPFAPGGGVDTTARIMAPKLTELMGQNWVVDNRTGAGGNLAAEIVARANPDGHTVLLAIDSQLTANPSLYALPFSVEKDLQPVIVVCATDQILVVHPGVAASTFKEFIALAKSKPGSFRYGSGGVGSANHLAAELLKKTTGIDIVHVPYKGAGPSIAGILAGEIQMNISSLRRLRSASSRAENCARSRAPASSARKCCRTCRPSRSRAIPDSRRSSGMDSSCPAPRPGMSWHGSVTTRRRRCRRPMSGRRWSVWAWRRMRRRGRSSAHA